MENEFKGTKGKWQSENVLTHNGDFFKVKCEDLAICNITTRNQTFAKANAQLIADAGNVRQQINFDLPELLKQRNEMLEMLIKCRDTLKDVYSCGTEGLDDLIKEATTI